MSVLTIRDLDTVRVGKREPLLGYRRHDLLTTAETVLVIEKVAVGLEIIGPGTSIENRW